ncbi:MAG: transcription factor S [Promethearchaeota archaeon]
MVDFCPDCSSLLRKKNTNGIIYLICKCGYQKKLEPNKSIIKEMVTKKKQALEKNLLIITEEDRISIHPKVSKICPKCGYTEAEAWQRQMRSADEPSTSFFKCVKCKNIWREN